MRWLILACLLSGCSIYQSTFDCPPGKGIGCKSVTEIEGMITEREEGPDLFYAKEIHAGKCSDCGPTKRSLKVGKGGELLVQGKERLRRIWVAEETTPSGNRVASHYVYFSSPDLGEWTVLNTEAQQGGEGSERS